MPTNEEAKRIYKNVCNEKFELSPTNLPEIALHAADDWYEDAKLRSDIRADLYSYYAGFLDCLKFMSKKQG